MGLVVNVIRKAVLLSLALFYASIVALALLYRTLRRPSRPFWYTKKRDAPPAVLNDPDLGTHKFLHLKDIKLHYVEKGDSSKPLILFVHGFPEFWYSWRHQIKEFSEDYWVIALDMRGYGDSEKPNDLSQYAMKHLVKDIKEFVDALGRDKFILVAHDWGGVVAWQFVYTHPEMLDKYVIMDSPHPRGFRKRVFSSWKQFRMSWYIFFFQIPYLPEVLMRAYDMFSFKTSLRRHRTEKESKVTDEDLEAFKYTFGKPGAFTGPINYYRANIARRVRYEPDSGKELPPGLMIVGEKDDYLSQELFEAAMKHVPSLKLEVIKDANHFVQQDAPEGVNKAVRNFLKEH